MRFSARLTVCFVVPAVLFVAAIGSGVWGLIRTQDEFDRYMKVNQKLSDGLSEMYAQGLQSGQALRNTVLDPDNKRAYDNLKELAAPLKLLLMKRCWPAPEHPSKRA